MVMTLMTSQTHPQPLLLCHTTLETLMRETEANYLLSYLGLTGDRACSQFQLLLLIGLSQHRNVQISPYLTHIQRATLGIISMGLPFNLSKKVSHIVIKSSEEHKYFGGPLLLSNLLLGPRAT